MTQLEQVIDELKVLQPEEVKQVANYVHTIREGSRRTRNEALRRAVSRFTPEDVEAIEAAIEEDCEEIDTRDW